MSPATTNTPTVNAIAEGYALNVSLVEGEIAAVTAQIDASQLAALASQIHSADRVFVAGAGRSGLALRMAAMRLMHLGLTVHVAGDTTTPAISSGDLLLDAPKGQFVDRAATRRPVPRRRTG